MLLVNFLGWSKPIAGRIVALQLVGLVEIFNSQSQNSASITGLLYSIVPKFYDSLTLAMKLESPSEVDLWAKLLRTKSVIWSSGRFINPSRITFNEISNNFSADPYLHVVKDDLLAYESLLEALGVRKAFVMNDLLAVLSEIEQKTRGNVLSAKEIELCVGLVRASHRMQNSTPSQENADYGSWVYLPDSTGVLIRASQLSYDDAPWASAALSQRSTTIKVRKFQIYVFFL